MWGKKTKIIEILKLPEVQQLSEVTGKLWEGREVSSVSQSTQKAVISQEDFEKEKRKRMVQGSRH